MQDYENWAKLTAALGDKILLVGDDLYTTNTRLIAQGLQHKWANALLLKVNQIGTISESMDAAKMLFGARVFEFSCESPTCPLFARPRASLEYFCILAYYMPFV